MNPYKVKTCRCNAFHFMCKFFISKSLLIIYIVIGILFSTIYLAPSHTYADEIPHAFWKLSEKYTEALNNADYRNTILYGWKIVDLFDVTKDNSTMRDIVTPKLEKIAQAYEKLGDLKSAVDTYKQYIPLAQKQNWDDGVKYAGSKVRILDFDAELYVKSYDTENNIYLAGKFEPKSGVYFGSTYDKDPRIELYDQDKVEKYFPKKNSAYLVYVDWGEDVSDWKYVFDNAKEDSIGIELAWNTYDSQTMRNVPFKKEYVEKTAKFLGDTQVPIFLRFANEMNVAENGDDPDAYIKAFQFVAELMKRHAPNVAMLWAPNDVSAEGRTYAQYYPGDEYVDWVGISSYQALYFQGKKDWGHLQDSIDSVFFTGPYVNPVAKIKPFMDEFAGKKPIMLSESGVSHYANYIKEDLSEWAKIQLRRLYCYVPMVYPQLKGMFYFNVDMKEHSTYALHANEGINNLYNELVESDYFLSNIGDAAPYRYVKADGLKTSVDKIDFSIYTIPPGVLTPDILCSFDAKSIPVSKDVPYTFTLNESEISDGTHILTINVKDGNKSLKTSNYSVTKKNKIIQINKLEGEQSQLSELNIPSGIQNVLNESLILYTGSSKAFSKGMQTGIDSSNPEVMPAVINGRTLVPVRFIAESFNASVDWNGETKTATLTTDECVITLTLGSNIMKVNGKGILLDVPAESINGRTLVPLRALAEALGKKIFYDRKLIIIGDYENILEPEADSVIIDELISSLEK